MSADTSAYVLLEAGTAAEKLAVSASGLRRLSLIYEAVYEELPRKPKSNNRLWPEKAVERLQTARALVQLERYRTIQEALEAVKRGLSDDEELEKAQTLSVPSQQSLEVLIGEFRSLKEELIATREQNQVLQNQLLKSLGVSLEETLAVRIARRFDRLVTSFKRK